MNAVQEAPAFERIRTVEVISREVDFTGNSPKEVERPETLLIRPLPFRRWPIVISHLANMIDFLPASGLDVSEGSATELAMWAFTLLGNSSDDLFGILQLATDRPPSFFDTLDPDDAIKIILAVVDINRDFFVEKLLPLINQYFPGSSISGIPAPTEQPIQIQ